MKLLVYLTEMGFFKKVQFIFLIVGHTKNAADRLFNVLKLLYRKDNIATMTKLLKALSTSDQVTVVPAEEDNFKDYTTFLNLFYGNFTKKIKKNHIFSCSFKDNRVGNQLEVHLRESNLDVHPIVKHNAFKTGFYC